MKASIIVAAAALALGSAAFAADDHAGTSRAHDKAQHAGHATKEKGEGLGQKLRRGMHNLGEKTRHAFHRGEGKVERTASRHDDTRSMGAGPSDSRMTDAERAPRQRMDDAYGNWHRRHNDTDKR